MSGSRAIITVLAILGALSTSWTLPSHTWTRIDSSYFVLDPATGHGFIASAETVAACAMPARPAPDRPMSCGSAGSPCGAVPASSSRPCGATSACGICFALGQLAMHTVESAAIPDGGMLPGRIEARALYASTRYVRPPQPPPRVV